MELVLATNNSHKVREIQAMLPSKIKLLTMAEVGLSGNIEETGKTIEENALLKARWVYEKISLPTIADDTGLEVFALQGAPGVYSARYAGEDGNSQKNIEKLLNDLSFISDRRAQFRCCIALIDKENEYLFEGKVTGKITDKPMGNEGFGYDPIFMPDGHHKTFAQMSAEEKNAISHRFKAVRKLVDFIKENYQ